MNKGIPYCLLHNYIVKTDKAYSKCRANKPINSGAHCGNNNKSSNDYRCKYLIFLKKGLKKC